MIAKLKKFLNPSTHRKLKMEARDASFRLVLGQLEVGTLRFKNGKWYFKYSEEFKETSGIKTLAGFPNQEKEYVSEELWPFFSSRIPSLSRSRVQKVLEKEGINENDLLQLLHRFGKRTIANPFELVIQD